MDKNIFFSPKIKKKISKISKFSIIEEKFFTFIILMMFPSAFVICMVRLSLCSLDFCSRTAMLCDVVKRLRRTLVS